MSELRSFFTDELENDGPLLASASSSSNADRSMPYLATDLACEGDNAAGGGLGLASVPEDMDACALGLPVKVWGTEVKGDDWESLPLIRGAACRGGLASLDDNEGEDGKRGFTVDGSCVGDFENSVRVGDWNFCSMVLRSGNFCSMSLRSVCIVAADRSCCLASASSRIWFRDTVGDATGDSVLRIFANASNVFLGDILDTDDDDAVPNMGPEEVGALDRVKRSLDDASVGLCACI